MIRQMYTFLTRLVSTRSPTRMPKLLSRLDCGVTQSFDLGFWPVELHGLLDEQVRYCNQCSQSEK